MNSSCSFTMGSNSWTLLCLSQSLSTNIVYSSVSIPFNPQNQPHLSHLYQPHLSYQYQPHLSYQYQPHLSYQYQPHPTHQSQPHLSHGHLYQPHLRHQSQPHLSYQYQLHLSYHARGPGADPGFQEKGGGGGVTYESWGVVHFRPIQPVCVGGGGGGVLSASALGQFNQWGEGVLSALSQFNQWVLSTYGSLYV